MFAEPRHALLNRMRGERFYDHVAKLALWGETSRIIVVGEDDGRDFCLHVHNILRHEVGLETALAQPSDAPERSTIEGALVLWCAELDRAEDWDQAARWRDGASRFETLKALATRLQPIWEALAALRRQHSPRDVIRVLVGASAEEARAAPLEVVRTGLSAVADGPASILGGRGFLRLYRRIQDRAHLWPTGGDWTVADPDEWPSALAASAFVGGDLPRLADPRWPADGAGSGQVRLCIDAFCEGIGAREALSWALSGERCVLVGRFAAQGRPIAPMRPTSTPLGVVMTADIASYPQAGRPASDVVLTDLASLEEAAVRSGRKLQVLHSIELPLAPVEPAALYACVAIAPDDTLHA